MRFLVRLAVVLGVCGVLLTGSGCARGGTTGVGEMKGMHVGEINVICRDLQRSMRFYRDALGFDSGETGDGYAHVTCGEREFLLLACAKQDAPRARYTEAPGFSVDLMVGDLRGAAEHLRRHGVTFEKEYSEGQASFWIRDPDGNVFEVIQSEKPSR